MVRAYGFSMKDFQTYMSTKTVPTNYRDECIDLIKQLDAEKLKSVYALISSFTH